jgi:hypothetical protein
VREYGRNYDRSKAKKRRAVPDGMKYCPKCDTVKSLEEFTKAGEYKAATTYCTPCWRDWQSEYYHANKDRMRRKSIARIYGITMEELEELEASHGNRCAVCKVEADTENRNLCVDHDHDTGKVRGLLCKQCNSAAGLLGDSSQRVAALAAYLVSHGK